MSASGPIGFFQRNGTVSIEIQPPVDIKLNFSITVKRKKYKVSYLRIGVPHCVMFVDSFDDIDVRDIGEKIRNLKAFAPDGVNVNFVTRNKNTIFVRTYERGVEDETLSCGSGVLASAYIATKLFMAESPITADTRGGQLQVTIKDKLYLEGPAKFVFDGVYYVE
jgi:diaminopimelate epimerase